MIIDACTFSPVWENCTWTKNHRWGKKGEQIKTKTESVLPAIEWERLPQNETENQAFMLDNNDTENCFIKS